MHWLRAAAPSVAVSLDRTSNKGSGRRPTPTSCPFNDYAGVMSAASWALMLCKPGMRPPTIVEPGFCSPAG
jgi:hypothetical protein